MERIIGVRRIAIDKVRDLLRLKLDTELSHDQTAAVLSISKGVVSKYLSLATKADLDWPTIRLLDDADLARKIDTVRSKRPSSYAVPDYARIHHELYRKGTTLLQLWYQYKAAHAGQRTHQYTQFCERYHHFVGHLRRSMRQLHCAGGELFIDFARRTIPLQGGGSARLFVAVMGASRLTFACATANETIGDWIESMERAFLFFGGAPKFIVPDSRQAMIAEPEAHRPGSNKDVLGLTRHYGTLMLPAHHIRALHEPNAASAAQVAMRWMMKYLRHQHDLASLEEVNQALQALTERLNRLPVKGLLHSRADAFALLDAPLLFPLPRARYEALKLPADNVRLHRRQEKKKAGVLVVNDTQGTAAYLQDALYGEYEVHSVSGEPDAQRVAAERSLDLVLIDTATSNPGALISSLREECATARTSIVLISGDKGDKNRIAEMNAGADDIIAGPITLFRLLFKVSGLLAQARLRRARLYCEEGCAEKASILEALNEGFISVDADWQITYVNPVAERLTGSSRTTALGKSCWELFPSMLGTTAERELRSAMGNRLQSTLEYFSESNGKWLEMSTFPLGEDALVLRARDITERKRAEEAL